MIKAELRTNNCHRYSVTCDQLPTTYVQRFHFRRNECLQTTTTQEQNGTFSAAGWAWAPKRKSEKALESDKNSEEWEGGSTLPARCGDMSSLNFVRCCLLSPEGAFLEESRLETSTGLRLSKLPEADVANPLLRLLSLNPFCSPAARRNVQPKNPQKPNSVDRRSIPLPSPNRPAPSGIPICTWHDWKLPHTLLVAEVRAWGHRAAADDMAGKKLNFL